MAEKRTEGFETICTHRGESPAQFKGAVTPPIFQSSLFTSPTAEAFADRARRRPELYDYTRVNNPTTDILEEKIAALEKTEASRCFASGMAAVTAVILHAAGAGEHVVMVDSAYGPSRSLVGGYLKRLGIEVTFVRGTVPEQYAAATKESTKLYYLESPSSLVFALQDIEAVVALARERGIVTAIDNSWASPYFQNPVEAGVDLVLHSATKYLGGHSDILGGVVAGSAQRMQRIASDEGALLGAVLDPFAAWLMIRGLRTLALRMERHQSNAMAVATFLAEHPAVERVFYPGHPSHPQHGLAKRQLRGFSGLLSFSLKDGDQRKAFAFVNGLKYFGIGVSWGGFESLAIPLPFPKDPFAAKKSDSEAAWGARLHIGLETVEDLLTDLDEALRGL